MSGTGATVTAPAGGVPAGGIHSLYPVTIEWLGGKRGRIGSPDDLADIEIASPPQFGGHPLVWSPEHLFVASALSCWLTTFVAIAAYSKLEVLTVTGGAEGEVAMSEDRRYEVSRMVLRPRVTIGREQDRDKALRLVAKAESNCLISRSMRTRVAVEPEIVVAAG